MHLQQLRLKETPVGGARSSLATGGCESKPDMFVRMSSSSSTCVPTSVNLIFRRKQMHSLFRVFVVHMPRGDQACAPSEQRVFQAPFAVAPVFKGCTWSVAGFLSCPSVALDALTSRRGRLTGVGAGGHWLGSHLISVRPPRLVRDDHNWSHSHDVGLALAGVGVEGRLGRRLTAICYQILFPSGFYIYFFYFVNLFSSVDCSWISTSSFRYQSSRIHSKCCFLWGFLTTGFHCG